MDDLRALHLPFFFSGLAFATAAALDASRAALRRAAVALPAPPAVPLSFAFAAFALAAVVARAPPALLPQSAAAAAAAAVGASRCCCRGARSAAAPDVYLAGAAGHAAGLLVVAVLREGGGPGPVGAVGALVVYLLATCAGYGASRATCLRAAPGASHSEDGAIRVMVLVACTASLYFLTDKPVHVLDAVVAPRVALEVLIAPHLVRGVVLAIDSAMEGILNDAPLLLRLTAPTIMRHMPAIFCAFCSTVSVRLVLVSTGDIATTADPTFLKSFKPVALALTPFFYPYLVGGLVGVAHCCLFVGRILLRR